MIFKVWAHCGHEVERVGSPEAAMHSLALLQPVIGDLNAGHHRLFWIGGELLERHHNGWRRQRRRTHQPDGAGWQRTGHVSVIVVDEYPIHIILPGQEFHDLVDQVWVARRKINQIGSAVRCDDDLGISLICNSARAADQSVACERVLANGGELLRNGRVDRLEDFLAIRAVDLTARVEKWKAQFMGDING